MKKLCATAFLLFLVRCPAPPESDKSRVDDLSPVGTQQQQIVASETAPAEPKESEDPFASALLIGGDVEAPTLIHQPTPDTPKDAKCRRLVMARLIIDESGKVAHVEDITPNPDVFTASWVESFRQSTYTPATKFGVPVRAQFHQSSQIKCSR